MLWIFQNQRSVIYLLVGIQLPSSFITGSMCLSTINNYRGFFFPMFSYKQMHIAKFLRWDELERFRVVLATILPILCQCLVHCIVQHSHPPSLYFSDADVKIALPSSDYVYDENAQTIKICANLTGDIERDLRIALLLEEETATCTYNHTTRSHTLLYYMHTLSLTHTTVYDPHGSRLGDVFRYPSPITFRQSNRLSNIACTDISLHDDSFLEPEVETFNVYLQNSDPGVMITTRTITVSLLDDDRKEPCKHGGFIVHSRTHTCIQCRRELEVY